MAISVLEMTSVAPGELPPTASRPEGLICINSLKQVYIWRAARRQWDGPFALLEQSWLFDD